MPDLNDGAPSPARASAPAPLSVAPTNTVLSPASPLQIAAQKGPQRKAKVAVNKSAEDDDWGGDLGADLLPM